MILPEPIFAMNGAEVIRQPSAMQRYAVDLSTAFSVGKQIRIKEHKG